MVTTVRMQDSERDCIKNPFKAYRLLYVPPGLTSKYSIWWSHCLYVFCMDHRTSSNLFLIQHSQTGFYNRGGECLRRGTDWILIYHRYVSSLKG